MHFIFLIIIAIATQLSYLMIKKWNIKIRRLPAIDALEECVGRAAEMGKPIHYTTGQGGTSGFAGSGTAPQILASLHILGYVAKIAGDMGTRIINTHTSPDVMMVAQDVIREGYNASGNPELFDPDDIRYITSQRFAFASQTMAIIEREQVAANIMLGFFAAEALMFAETGYRIGAMQIAGTAQVNQIPVFVAVCDYVLMAEELFAAGAYYSKDPYEVGAILGQDGAKALAILLILFGALLVTFGNDLLGKILGM